MWFDILIYIVLIYSFDLWIKCEVKKSVTTIKMTTKITILPLFLFYLYSLPISGLNDFCNLKGLCEVINKSVLIEMWCSLHVLPNSQFKICTYFRTNQLWVFKFTWVHFPSDFDWFLSGLEWILNLNFC